MGQRGLAVNTSPIRGLSLDPSGTLSRRDNLGRKDILDRNDNRSRAGIRSRSGPLTRTGSLARHGFPGQSATRSSNDFLTQSLARRVMDG